jgi:hypothetical protein
MAAAVRLLLWRSLPKFNGFPSIRATNQPVRGNSLLNRPQQQRQFRSDDREQITSARQAAEALFTPKPEVTEQPVSDPSQSDKARKPRVLPILAPAPIRQETIDTPSPSEPATAHDIPAKKSAQLRTLVEYGMTVSQVADIYGVPVETIERILQKA